MSRAEEAGSLCSTRSSEDANIELSDVSASNDEGITALHNAICAGHYEIVRFLIDAKADVNTQFDVQKPSRAVKGILRPKGRPATGRRIEFDPLALLLDAALEGEIDLVKESAKKLSDVSASNDEGITALHNSICAGHYEIVRFLIDANADVNAQDSCNNLPMVRVLVVGGVCLLSSTLSDLETPVQKWFDANSDAETRENDVNSFADQQIDRLCEEDDGYDGCLRYLIAAHNATGTTNTGTVTSFSFDFSIKSNNNERDQQVQK